MSRPYKKDMKNYRKKPGIHHKYQIHFEFPSTINRMDLNEQSMSCKSFG